MVPDLRSAAGLPAAGGGSANFLSRRGRRRGGDLFFDFCCSFLLAPRRCLLQRRREEGDGYAGAGAASLLGLAAGWRFRRALPGMRPVGGSSRLAPRRRRPELRDLKIGIEPGDDPRPARHSDMWASRLLPVVHKALGRWGSPDLGFAGRRSSSSSIGGVGDGRRCWPDGAAKPRDLGVILFSSRGFFAFGMALRILPDRIPWVCTSDVLYLSTN